MKIYVGILKFHDGQLKPIVGSSEEGLEAIAKSRNARLTNVDHWNSIEDVMDDEADAIHELTEH